MAVIAGVGLLAGLLGGMLGVGGSLIMIPAMVWLLGQDRTSGYNQHLYQAAAMIVNVAVVAPAAVRHHMNRLVVWPVVWRIAAVAAGAILVGVWLSNRFSGPTGAVWLGRVLGVFIVYVVGLNVWKLVRPTGAGTPTQAGADGFVPAATGASAWRCGVVGGVMGLAAGLLGIGGGALAVPLQQVLLKLPLKRCIANSTAVICVTAGIGAIYKNTSLPMHGLSLFTSVTLAGLLIPTAIVGGWVGARLTHVLPTRAVRGVFVVVLLVAGWRLLATGG